MTATARQLESTPSTNWPCEVCGKDGTPDEHVLLTSGSLNAGTLRAHTFCPEHNPLSKRKAAQ